MDNIFVIAVIFGRFAVPQPCQHRVLFWGILGALVLRGVMIALGATLISEFHWILYLFAAFLILTALTMLFLETERTDPSRNPIARLTRRSFPVTADEFRYLEPPLALVLMAVGVKMMLAEGLEAALGRHFERNRRGRHGDPPAAGISRSGAPATLALAQDDRHGSPVSDRLKWQTLRA